MPDFPDYSKIPDLTHFHVMGTYVFVDNIAIGPANSKALVAASISHAHASERHDMERAVHPADSTEAEVAAAKSATEHWWSVTCALAAGQLVTGRLVVAEPTKLAADLDEAYTPTGGPAVGADDPTFDEAYSLPDEAE